MDESQNPEHNPEHPVDLDEFAAQHKGGRGFWSKIGGGALTFAIIFHVILLIIGAIWIFQVIREPEKKVDFLPGGGSAGGGERSAQTKVQQKKRAQITPSTNVKRVFAEGAASTYAIPDPGDNFGEMSALSSLTGGGMSGGLGGTGSGGGFGSGHGTGSGLGMGGGAGKLFGLIPDTMRKRCSKDDRLQRLRENGGTPACEDAVLKGLRWMKANQQPNGAFDKGGHSIAMTGLALLAYFGHCETPVSEEFGDSCLRGITFLVNQGMKNDGKLANNFTANSWCYEHAIATYALGEAYTFCKELKVDVPNLAEVTEKAGQFIIANQHDNGGWAYAYSTASTGAHTDLSIVGWQIQALKACSHTSIKFPGMNGAISRGLKYVESVQNTEGAFGYASPPPLKGGKKPTLTGVGMLCFQMWGKGRSSTVSKAAKSVLENLEFEYNKESSNLYQHYYESQAMMQRGGKDWDKYNQVFRDQILNNQNADGSWKNPGHNGHGATQFYNTCLCTLMLEVYYRFLSTGGGGGMRERHGI